MEYSNMTYEDARKFVPIMDAVERQTLAEPVMLRWAQAQQAGESISDWLMDQTPFENVLVEYELGCYD
jgi:hypothetical protein